MKDVGYERLSMEILEFSTPDIITTSNTSGTTTLGGDNYNIDTTVNYP